MLSEFFMKIAVIWISMYSCFQTLLSAELPSQTRRRPFTVGSSGPAPGRGATPTSLLHPGIKRYMTMPVTKCISCYAFWVKWSCLWGSANYRNNFVIPMQCVVTIKLLWFCASVCVTLGPGEHNRNLTVVCIFIKQMCKPWWEDESYRFWRQRSRPQWT